MDVKIPDALGAETRSLCMLGFPAMILLHFLGNLQPAVNSIDISYMYTDKPNKY